MRRWCGSGDWPGSEICKSAMESLSGGCRATGNRLRREQAEWVLLSQLLAARIDVLRKSRNEHEGSDLARRAGVVLPCIDQLAAAGKGRAAGGLSFIVQGVEFGRAGGAVVNTITKSGTNQLHGLVSELFRERPMQHRRFMQIETFKQAGTSLHFHMPDANLSGPVYLPKIYDGRNRTFFFATAEWFRNRIGASSVTALIWG